MVWIEITKDGRPGGLNTDDFSSMDESQAFLGDRTAPRTLMKEKFSPLINHSEINAPSDTWMNSVGSQTACWCHRE